MKHRLQSIVWKKMKQNIIKSQFLYHSYFKNILYIIYLIFLVYTYKGKFDTSIRFSRLYISTSMVDDEKFR